MFVERLKPHGYEYFVLDGGWYRDYELAGREFPCKGDPYVTRFDEFGRPSPSTNCFPRGVAIIADECHAAGVKFGIHMMRGISRAAVEANTPIKGTKYRARDIADTSDTCKWCADNFGVDMSRQGAQAFYDSIIEMLAGWGVDFIKYDDIVPAPDEVDAVVDAVERCDRDIVPSLSPGNGHDMTRWHTYRRANMMRISGDIWDNREDFRWVFDRWQQFMPLLDTQPDGFWLDQDMIPFGELCVWNSSEGKDAGNALFSGRGTRRMSGLNEPQKQTFITMRALGASPLFFGGNLPGTDEFSFRLVTDPEMLACNQNGVTGRLVAFTDCTSTWKTPHRNKPDCGWLGVFNRDGANPQQITLDAASVNIPPDCRLFDIWNRRDLGSLSHPLQMTLPPDEVLFVRYSRGG